MAEKKKDKKLWGGRFKEKTASSVEDFTESVSFDKRLARYDIAGSIAHAEMLMKAGIISKKDGRKIIKGLKEILKDIEAGRFNFKKELEDVHMNIEHALIARIGEAGARLHTARSRNDQVVTDLRLYLRDEIGEIIKLLKGLVSVLINLAEKNIDIIMPGYTHLQRAQPVLLSHHLLAHAWGFLRDMERFRRNLESVNIMPLGSCALAGTSLPTDRRFVARRLGFKEISLNSMDGVSDRDFCLEFLFNSAVTMMHLSRLAEELIIWSSVEFNFIELPDAYTTGSSIMPQKKNPDVLELIRGKTGRTYGNLVSLLTVLKGLPLTYNRDMQEDKEPIFDSADTLKSSLSIISELLPLIKFNKEAMHRAAGGFCLATDVAEYLVKKGVPFRRAHEITGRMVRYCLEKGVSLESLSAEDMKRFAPEIEPDILSLLKPESSVKAKSSTGGTSHSQVKNQIKILKRLLNNLFLFVLQLLILLPLVYGCGKKSDIPYKRLLIPQELTGVEYIRRPEGIWINWEYPEPEKEGLFFEIFRCEPEQKSEKKDLCQSLGRTTRRSFVDYNPSSKELVYSIAYSFQDGVRKERVITVPFEGYPLAPEELKYEILNKGIRLSWHASEECQYNIYRVLFKDQSPFEVLISRESTRGEFIDTPDSFQPVHYRIRCKKGHTEGFPGDLIISPDDYVPSRPEGLRYAVTEQGVVLTWKENPEKWLKGYKIYRNNEVIGESPYPLFVDTVKIDGSGISSERPSPPALSYSVSAIGPSREGPLSEPVIVKLRSDVRYRKSDVKSQNRGQKSESKKNFPSESDLRPLTSELRFGWRR
jgi:argininosuccinate lyase